MERCGEREGVVEECLRVWGRGEVEEEEEEEREEQEAHEEPFSQIKKTLSTSFHRLSSSLSSFLPCVSRSSSWSLPASSPWPLLVSRDRNEETEREEEEEETKIVGGWPEHLISDTFFSRLLHARRPICLVRARCLWLAVDCDLAVSSARSEGER